MRDVVRKSNKTDDVREINYRYDSTNKLTEVVQDGVVVDYKYDGSGNRILTSYTGDSSGALTAEKNIKYNYDKFNRLDSIGIEYKTGKKTSYYKVRQYEYKNSGKINNIYDYRQFESGGAAVTKAEYNYNSMGMPETLIYKDSTDGKNYVQKEKYTVNYDKRGYILNEECITNYDNKELKVNKSYKYDDIGNLLNSTNKSSELENTVSYIYDAVGNRKEMHTESKGKENKKESLYYEYNEFNGLLNIKKKQGDTTDIVSRYRYDEAGNQIEEINKKELNSEKFEEKKSYKYDSLDRLTNAEVKTKEEDVEGNKEVTKNIENKYDGDGKRIWQKEDGYETGYFYDGDSILFTTEPNLKKAQENILMPSGKIIASKRVDGDYKDKYLFYNYDLRGSVSSILKPEGGAAKRYEYDEFGNTKEVTNSNIKNDVKFAGATQDKSTNLYHMGARYYDSTTGRFLTQDTFKGSYNSPWTQHLYNYCSNNPINYTDPIGHFRNFIVATDDAGHEYIPTTGRTIDYTKNTGYTPPAPQKSIRQIIGLDKYQIDYTKQKNYATIQGWTTQDHLRSFGSKSIPCIPVLNTINDLKISTSGRDLMGYCKSADEIQDAKVSVFLSIGTGLDPEFGKEIRYDWWR